MRIKRQFTLSFALATLTLFGIASAAETQTFNADLVHSFASFAVRHFGISRVSGTIPVKSAVIKLRSGSNVPVAVSAELDPAGVDTHNGMRDGDLRSPHFLDVTIYPHMSFASTAISGDEKHLVIVGNLTLHGQTHPVTLNGEFLGRAAGPRGDTHVGFTATTSLDRTQWGMTYGGPIVGNNVDITVDVDAISR
ncbi:MAG: polyisoprenoid-binding protein [Candidatus Meridianibacter frigidus]|nr:MAG: polyisoprenoid-binding protein [Candidatus Eremiobacteraeota bacterium]